MEIELIVIFLLLSKVCVPKHVALLQTSQNITALRLKIGSALAIHNPMQQLHLHDMMGVRNVADLFGENDPGSGTRDGS